jgi:hypothetical protein
MTRFIYLKYEVDPLRNNYVTVKKKIFFKEDKSGNIGARFMNLVT